MNEIRFDIQHSECSNLVVPVIDGTSLISILKKLEKPFAEKEAHLEIAGGYNGIPIEFIESPTNYYHGLIKIDWLNDKTVILDCPCLIVGCWSFVAKIEVEKNKVIWKNFEQIHRDNWDYSKLDKFIFDKAQYQKALKALKEIKNK